MLFKKLLFVCFFFLSFISSGRSAPNTIQAIKVITENQPLKLKLEKQLVYFQGKSYSLALKNTIRQKVFDFLKKKKFFWPNVDDLFVSTSPQGVMVSVLIKHPYRYGWIVKGNKAIPTHQLISKTVKEQIFNHKKAEQKLIELIKTTYLKKGYFKISIQSRMQTDFNRFAKTIRLSITEGSVLKIKDIQVTGRFSRPVAYYRRLIKKNNQELIQNNFFYRNDWEKGIELLKNQLKNEGYLQATVYSKITKEKNKVIIQVNINEGPLTQIHQITFKGNRYFSDYQLKNLIQTKSQAGWNPKLLEQDIRTIINAYKEQGFIEVTINTDQIISYNQATAQVNLLFDITENQKIIVSDILIQGGEITDDYFIRQALPLKVHDILTSKKINHSIKSLRKLGIFSSVDILVVHTKQKKSHKRIVIVRVKESKPGLIRLGAGLNTERILTARGFIQLSNKNLWGTGRGIFSNIKLQSNMAQWINRESLAPAHLEHQADLIYTEPFLFHSLFTGQVSLSKANTISLYNRDQNSLNIASTIKWNLNLQREITPYINGQWTVFSWEGKEEFEKSFACLYQKCKNRILNLASSGLAINVDKRNQVISTSDGFLSNWFIEYTGPYFINSSKEINFIKMEMKHFDFRPIFAQGVWVNSLQGGMILNLNEMESSGFPVSRAFILGGVNSLRGFDGLLDGQRVPDKEELDISGANQIITANYSVFFLLKTEFRFPINDQLNGSIFYDGGSVKISDMDFKQPYRQSTGFGIRYQTPLGAISLYLAFKIFHKKHELLFLPHLSFGTF